MSIRDMFPGYYRPTKDEFTTLWQDCIFAFDANLLLHIYRFESHTRDVYFDYLKRLQGRIWAPHQAYMEFQQDRLAVIATPKRAYTYVTDQLDASLRRLEADFTGRYKRHPRVNVADVMMTLRHAQQQIEQQMQGLAEDHPTYLEADPLRDRLDALFEGHVGSPYSRDEMEEKRKEADRRIRDKVPPGYRDQGKDKRPQVDQATATSASDEREGVRRYGGRDSVVSIARSCKTLQAADCVGY